VCYSSFNWHVALDLPGPWPCQGLALIIKQVATHDDMMPQLINAPYFTEQS
jgi:hypothetical protein